MAAGPGGTETSVNTQWPTNHLFSFPLIFSVFTTNQPSLKAPDFSFTAGWRLQAVITSWANSYQPGLGVNACDRMNSHVQAFGAHTEHDIFTLKTVHTGYIRNHQSEFKRSHKDHIYYWKGNYWELTLHPHYKFCKTKKLWWKSHNFTIEITIPSVFLFLLFFPKTGPPVLTVELIS